MDQFGFIAMALGLFFGNWFVSPFIVRGRSFKDGFFVGLITVVIFGFCVGLYLFIQKLMA